MDITSKNNFYISTIVINLDIMDNSKFVLGLLESVLGNGVPTKNGDVDFYCPVCNHKKRKLIVNINTGAYNCWSCFPPTKGGNPSTLLKKIGAKSSVINEMRGYFGQRAVKQEEEEIEEEEQFFFPEEEKEEELEFEDYDVPSKDREDEGFSPNTKMIVSILKEINQVKDLEGISDIIESAIQAIKVQKMSKQVKRNRINFFATQRS